MEILTRWFPKAEKNNKHKRGFQCLYATIIYRKYEKPLS